MSPTPKQIQDLRLANFMTLAEVAAKTDLSPTEVGNAEKIDSAQMLKRRQKIHAAIREHGTGLPHLGRTIRWKVVGVATFTGVVIQSPFHSQHAHTITDSVFVYCLEEEDNRIVHRDHITEVIR